MDEAVGEALRQAFGRVVSTADGVVLGPMNHGYEGSHGFGGLCWD